MRIKNYTIIVILMFSAIAAFAQTGFDPKSIVVTRWLDTTTSPLTYADYIKSQDFALRANIKLVSRPSIATDETIDIFVNENLYPQIESSLDTFFYDLSRDGYGINLYTAANTQSPAAIRQTLYDDFMAQNIEGAILIGDLAVPWYEMTEPWDSSHSEFPCDLYYMELNGNWGDSDNDGMFDTHTGPGPYADIWAGRLYASSMHAYGPTRFRYCVTIFIKTISTAPANCG